MIVAIPRSGAPIGHRVAEAYGVPLVVLSVKKVGAPSNPEFAVGAVTDGDVVYLDERAVRALGLDDGRDGQDVLSSGTGARRDVEGRRRPGRLTEVRGRTARRGPDGARRRDDAALLGGEQFYASFPQVGDDEVRALLSEADSRRGTNT